MALYYVRNADGERGPYTPAQLSSMWKTGTVTADSHYRSENSQEWLPMMDLFVNDISLSSEKAAPVPAPRAAAKAGQEAQSLVAVVALGFLVLVIGGCGLIACGKCSSPSAPPAAQNAADYDIGYRDGFTLGKDHAQAGAGMPTAAAFNGIVAVRFNKSGARDPEPYGNGLKQGFKDGYAAGKVYR